VVAIMATDAGKRVFTPRSKSGYTVEAVRLIGQKFKGV
jgi:hypothetical protein